MSDWVALDSKSVLRARYDASLQQLVLTFRSGRSYEYSGVPQSVFEWLRRVPCKGAFVRRMIVGSYAERRLADAGASLATLGDLEQALSQSLELAAKSRS